MPPKTKFGKEEIIDAAFELAREHGFDGITARNVAKRLGSSVAPIYVNFENIDQLVEAVVQRVFAISGEMLVKQQGPDVFANIGRASLEFAREYPVFLRELTLKPNPYLQSYEAMEEAMIEAMGQSEDMKDWSVEERKSLFFKMRAFQLGMTVMVANKQVPSWLNQQTEKEILMEAGDDFLLAHQVKKGREQ